jgi:heme ABC exporter ATP-binding subunit CcmA
VSGTEIMVHVDSVTKRFGTVWALRGLSLYVGQGRCLAIFGPNGAGKSTLFRILATLARPSTGTVSIAGHNVIQQAEKVRPLLGVVAHRTFLYGHLTAAENLWFYGRLFGVQRLPERIREVLQAVRLETSAHQLVRTYSRGMQQRLTIARAILHHPAVLLLDEPYTSLDQHAIAHVQELLQQLLTMGRTIILSTHDFQRGLELCDDIAIQCQGKIVYHSAAAGIAVRECGQLYAKYAE